MPTLLLTALLSFSLLNKISWDSGKVVDGIALSGDSLLLSVTQRKLGRELASLWLYSLKDSLKVQLCDSLYLEGSLTQLHLGPHKKILAYRRGDYIGLIFLVDCSITIEKSVGGFSQSISLSPDGRYLAYLTPAIWEARANLYFLDISSLKSKRITNLISYTEQNRVWKVAFGSRDVYILQGYAYGTIPHGGDLYKISLPSLEKKLLKRTGLKREFRDLAVIGTDTVLLFGINWDEHSMNAQPFIAEYTPKKFNFLLVSPLFFPNFIGAKDWDVLKTSKEVYILTAIEDGIWRLYRLKREHLIPIYEFPVAGECKFIKNSNLWVLVTSQEKSILFRFKED